MIIGISGKIGSGKDTVGKIIMQLDDIAHPAISTVSKHDFKIVKFADKVKDIVCILIGCTREQLEDEEFKNKELGEEWRVWYHKDNDPEGSELTIHTTEEEAWRYSKYRLAYQPNVYSEILTPRKLLQLIGTDCGRNIIHPNIWINATMRDYKPSYPNYNYANNDNDIRHIGKNYSNSAYSNWIITDVRFPNEAKAIEDRNGFLIRVNRIQAYMENKANSMRNGDYNIHTSETALDNYTFKYTIDNFGTIGELIDKVKDILIKEKIL